MEPITLNLPVLALRGLTVFPHMNMTFDVERRISIAALERAMETDQDIFLVTQRESLVDTPKEADLYEVGTISHIRQILRLSPFSVRVMVEGRCRARLRRLWQAEPYLQAAVGQDGAAVHSGGVHRQVLDHAACANFAEDAMIGDNAVDAMPAAVKGAGVARPAESVVVMIVILIDGRLPIVNTQGYIRRQYGIQIAFSAVDPLCEVDQLLCRGNLDRTGGPGGGEQPGAEAQAEGQGQDQR